jgi:phosphohistidine phosphatase SixA
LGDPPGFQIGDCGTQRNLSQEGRNQARRVGAFFEGKGIKGAAVYSSQWCRCLETARLLNLGPVKELPALNSFFQDSSTEETQTMETQRFIMSLPAGKATILVTHQVNITALTGIFPSSGEVIIFQLAKDGRIRVLGRFTP